MAEHQEIEYDDTLVAMLEMIWGEGFLSPGGAEEVALLLEGEYISGKKVIDIGCGIGGIDVLLVTCSVSWCRGGSIRNPRLSA